MFTHVQSSSREATYVHAQFTAHEEHPSSRPTHSTLRPYRSTDFVQYLSQTTAEILAPPFAQHTPRESFIRFSDRQVFLQTLAATYRNLGRLNDAEALDAVVEENRNRRDSF